MKELGIEPVLERELDLNDLAALQGAFTETLGLKLNDFLAFGLEGTGPAFGEQDNRGDDGWSEEMSAMQTELEKTKEDSASYISSLQAASDAEKARLQTAIEVREAELQSKMQEKTRKLEQRLADATRELKQANETNARAEERGVLVNDDEDALREKISQISQERDEVEANFQELRNEAYSLKQALEDANAESNKQTASIAVLETKSANLTSELANLMQTVVPENKQLRSELSSLQDNLEIAAAELSEEKTQAVDVKAALTRFESSNKSLAQELQRLKGELQQSEESRSDVEEERDSAMARVTRLENETTKRKARIQDLVENLRAAQAGQDVALSELERVKELMTTGLSEAERNVIGLHLKIARLENRVELLTTNNNDLNAANLVLEDCLAQEEAERTRVGHSNERLKSKVSHLTSRVEIAEEQSSVIGADLASAESKLRSYQTILKDERERYKKLVDDLQREKIKSADMEGRLEGLGTTAEPQISKLTEDLRNAGAEAKKFSDLYNSTRVELQKARREWEVENLQAEKQARRLKTEIERAEKLESEVEKALQRSLEYDKEGLYEQLSSEREAHERCKIALQNSETGHASDVSRLESEIQRMNGEIKSRDDKIRRNTDSFGDVEGKVQQELLEKIKLDLNVQGLQNQVAQLSTSLAYEQINRAEIERRFNVEVSNHLSTRLSLSNETQRANNTFKQLSYANSEREFQSSRADRLESELIEKKDLLQKEWQEAENLRAANRNLHRQIASRHSDCVELSDVKTLIGSYTRLFDTAAIRKRNRRQALHKKHFPGGFCSRDGKQRIQFRDEWV
ncbi:hypothetical protein F5Y14DRAFT_462126 [Nemania sp. NC0429]|nr:hypothetical protein F5Y14DRAFT_462126 [Nemania sp. NC0429]